MKSRDSRVNMVYKSPNREIFNKNWLSKLFTVISIMFFVFN